MRTFEVLVSTGTYGSSLLLLCCHEPLLVELDLECEGVGVALLVLPDALPLLPAHLLQHELPETTTDLGRNKKYVNKSYKTTTNITILTDKI